MLALALLPATARGASASPETSQVAALGLLEAVELTLGNDPNIALVESRLAAARGVLLAAGGRFDPLLSASLFRDDTEIPTSDGPAAETTILRTSLGLTYQLRGGLSLEPSLLLLRTDAPLTVNEATVSFTLRQPLLRGRGRDQVAAGERAAQLEVEAGRLDLEHRIAERLRAVAAQYWATRAAMLDLDILRATEQRSRQLLETTRRLIAADVTPAAEILQLEADLASQEASRIAGERLLFETRQDLGREIGLEPARVRDLALPGAAFPTVDPDEIPREDIPWTAGALEHRADLRAARQRRAAAEILLRAAEGGLAPQLDLVLTPSYSGLDEGNALGNVLSPLFSGIPGLSTSFGLNLSWPTRNRRAEGDLILAEEALEQSSVAVALAERDIGAEVAIALDAVERNARQLERIAQAVGFYQQTVANEVKKLRAGSSTLIDLITQRDRLTAARRQEVSAHFALALALLELRFQTGTLTEPDAETRSIGRENLTTLPF